MYPITTLVQQELAARGWRKSHLVAAMGYKDLSRGLRRLDGCLRDGDCANRELLARLRLALHLREDVLHNAVVATRQQRAREARLLAEREEAERRAAFRPYVYVRTSETHPSSITAAAVIGPRLKRLALDNATVQLPRAQLLARVAELVRAHYTENFGKCLLFGSITGYAFRISYDATVEYATDGTVVGERDAWSENEGIASMRVGHHVVRDGLFSLAC